MELDQDLLNLWLQAEQGLSTEQTRRLIEALQIAREAVDDLDTELRQQDLTWYGHPFMDKAQWGLDLQTPTELDPDLQALQDLLEGPLLGYKERADAAS